MAYNDNNRESGVSEVIGFMLIISLMITGIGLVTLYGYPILLKEQATANVKNMEKNMIVLQNDIKGLAYRNVPYTETTMQISGGTLQVIRPNPTVFPGNSRFIISSNGFSDIYTYYPGLLQFNSTSDTDIIGLQNGAVVTNGFSQTGGSTMLSEPRWFLDTNQSGKRTLVISIVNITSDYAISNSGGIRTVQMNISAGEPIDRQLAPNTQVYVQYLDNGEGYQTAWKNYFLNQQLFPDSYLDPNTIKMTAYHVDRLVIKTCNVTILNL